MILIKSKTILDNKNGVVIPTKRKYCIRNIAVTPKLTDLKANANGTYPVPDGYAGFENVIVAIDGVTEMSLAIGGTFEYTYDGNSPTVECPSCLTCQDDGGVIIFTAVSAGSGTVYIRNGDTVLAQYSVTVSEPMACTCKLTVGDTFTYPYTDSMTVDCPLCLTYEIVDGDAVFTAVSAGSGTVYIRDSDTVLAEYSITVVEASTENGGG